MSDWAKVRRKAQEGADATFDVQVVIGDDVATLQHGLIPSKDFWPLYAKIDLATLGEYQDDGESDTASRYKELQSKSELTDAEREELQDLAHDLQGEELQALDELGEDTFEAIREAGLMGLEPDAEDVDAVFDSTTSAQEERFGRVPTTRDEARECLKQEMREVLSASPYPVEFMVGQQVFAESTTALGNTELQSSPE